MDVEELLLNAKAVLLSPTKPFTYTSGNKGPIYCDNRIMISHPEAREQIVEGLVAFSKALDFDIVAGTATAGIPWAAFVAQKLGKPMIYVRSKKKAHGTGGFIEGLFEKGKKVLLVEDTINFATSSSTALQVLRGEGMVCDHCLAIYTHELHVAKEKFTALGCELHVLARFSVLVDSALSKGLISPKEKGALLSWQRDPLRWKCE